MSLNVSDLMSTDPVTIGPEDNLARAWDLMDQHHIRHLPVAEDGELVGLVSKRDLLQRALGGDHDDELPLSHLRRMLHARAADEVMVRGVETADPNESLSDAAERMLEHKFGCLPVVAGSRIVGILTEADFVRHVARAQLV